jgi:hypothetical protein
MKLLLILFASLLSVTAFGQDKKCEVKMASLTGYYSGDCKKGFANGDGRAEGLDVYEGAFKKGYPYGKGTYTWRNGNMYEGEFVKGDKHGEGVLKMYRAGKDSTVVGFWRRDEYIGREKLSEYKVVSKRNIDRITFRETKGAASDVRISFIKMGVKHNELYGLTVNPSSGLQNTSGGEIIIEQAEFPLVVRLDYSTPNKLKSSTLDVQI